MVRNHGKMLFSYNYKVVLPKSIIGNSLHYSVQHWKKLMVYTTDGRLEIDNNLAKNDTRPVVIGRKNYLFAGSHSGVRWSGIVYSFLGACRIDEVNPLECLRDVLSKIQYSKLPNLEELLPAQWNNKLQ